MEHQKPSSLDVAQEKELLCASESMELDYSGVRDEVGDLLAGDEPAVVFQRLKTMLEGLPPALRTWFLSLVALCMVLSAQGCMYAPRYGEVFGQSAQAVSPREAQSRAREIQDFLENPTIVTTTPALQSGIEPFQQVRIWRHFQDLLSVSEEDFDEFMELCRSAKSTLGIMNPDRYTPGFLKTVLENYHDPELHRERPVILAIIARKDRESFGVQALNVETFRLQELTQAYKVIVVETSSAQEILHHINYLGKQNILRLGNLKGVVIAGHGSAGEIDVGLNVQQELMRLSRLNWYFMKKDQPSFLVLASCESGEGAESGFDGFSNFTNQAALLFPRSQVLGCDGIMTGIEFGTDANGRIIDRSVQLERLSDFFGGGDTTYRPQYDAVIARAVPYYRQFIGEHIPVVYLEFALRAGLIKSNDILQAFRSGVDPFEFRLYVDCGLSYGQITEFQRNNIAGIRVFQYFQAGENNPSRILELVREGVTPEELLADAGRNPTERIPYLVRQR